MTIRGVIRKKNIRKIGYPVSMFSKVICNSELLDKAGLSLEVYPSREEACRAVAEELAHEIRGRREMVLGLATGSTPLPFYRELVRRQQEERLSFRGVVGFNLDEYEGLSPEHPESYCAFMQRHFYGQIEARAGYLPPGIYQNAEQACTDYERKIREAGGIDWQLLGIGGNGHIAFNEPGSARDSRTRRVELDERTRLDAAETFGGIAYVPKAALTMGVGTVLEAERIVLMAWGEGKSEILRRALLGPETPDLPASFLQSHGRVKIVTDLGAGGWALS